MSGVNKFFTSPLQAQEIFKLPKTIDLLGKRLIDEKIN